MATQNKPPHLIDDPNVQHHNLTSTWKFHYLIPSREGNKEIPWEQFLKPLHSFYSLEDFCAILQSIEPPERIPQGIRYYIFKENISPLWEDPGNLGGYQIIFDFPIQMPRKGEKGPPKIPKGVVEKWRELTIRLLIEDDKPYTKNANGIEFNNRGKTIKISIWYNKNAKPEDIDKNKEILSQEMETLKLRFTSSVDKIITEEEKINTEKEKKEHAKEEKEQRPPKQEKK